MNSPVIRLVDISAPVSRVGITQPGTGLAVAAKLRWGPAGFKWAKGTPESPILTLIPGQELVVTIEAVAGQDVLAQSWATDNTAFSGPSNRLSIPMPVVEPPPPPPPPPVDPQPSPVVEPTLTLGERGTLTMENGDVFDGHVVKVSWPGAPDVELFMVRGTTQGIMGVTG